VIGAALLALAAVAGAARFQPAASDSSAGAALTIYLLTFDSGAAVWERFGHNALWVHDPVAGTDWAYDYGRFSFREKNFFLRFAKGDLRYWMGRGHVRQYLAGYEEAGRSIWSQQLDLPPAARATLRDFLEWNVREENKFYHYDYYRDNCSTRIRDAIDRVIGGQLRPWAEAIGTSWTYRDHTRRLTQNNPLLYTGLLIGLGQPVDRRINAWEEMFLPITLRPRLDSFQVRDPDGRVHPIVKEARRLVTSDRFPVPDRPANWLPGFLAVGLALGLLLGGLARTRSGRGFVAGATLFALLIGIGGAVLAGLWAFTDHRFSDRNENVLQLSLLSLALAFVLPRAARRRTAERLAGAAALTAAVGLTLKALPGFGQANYEVIALLLPAHAGLWLGLRWLRRPPVTVV